MLRLAQSLHPVDPERALPGDQAYLIHTDGVHGHMGTVVARGGGWTASVDGNLGNQVAVVRYPTAARKYVSVERPIVCPAVPLALPLYAGSTR